MTTMGSFDRKASLRDHHALTRLSQFFLVVWCFPPSDDGESQRNIEITKYEKINCVFITTANITMRESKKKLRLDQILVGREDELKQLDDIHDHIMQVNAPVHACFVHGVSGSGKTALCRELKRNREKLSSNSDNMRSYFVEGKFDEYQDSSHPFSALVQALESLCAQLYDDPEETKTFIQSLKVEGKIMAEVVPGFEKLLHQHTSPREETDQDSTAYSHDPEERRTLGMASKRFALGLELFLKHFCASQRALVLDLDDLQWADTTSLDVLKAVVNDSETNNLLVLLSYRDEDDGAKNIVRPFHEALTIRNVFDISVPNLNQSSVHSLILTALSIGAYLDDTEEKSLHELSSIVCRRTMGNPFFVVQFVRMLEQEGVLSYDFFKASWKWDMERLLANTNVADNVAVVVTHRLQNVAPQVRRLLQLASCLGFHMDKSLLRSIFDNPTFLPEGKDEQHSNSLAAEFRDSDASRASFDQLIKLAESEHFLECPTPSTVKFPHDRIRQFSYELMSEKLSRSSLHHNIGKFLHDLHGDSFSSPYLLLTADQLNLGSSVLDGEDDRLTLIHLNLQASKLARERSSEYLVYNFLTKGYDLIKDTDWENSYDLVLDIYTCLAGASSERNNWTLSNSLVDGILKHARHAEHRASALAIRAKTCSSQLDDRQAIVVSKDALKILGVKTRASTIVNLIVELFRVKRMVQGLSDDDLLSLKPIENQKIKKAMRILVSLSTYSMAVDDSNFCGLAFCKLMELTVRHGFCAQTSVAYAAYAQLLAGSGKRQEAVRFSQLALRVDQDSNPLPSTISFTHTMCLHFKLPLQSALEPCLAG